MKLLLAVFVPVLCLSTALLPGATTTAKTTKKSPKTTAKRPVKKVSASRTAITRSAHRPAVVSAAARAAARDEIDRKMAAVEVGVENPAALANYFTALNHAAVNQAPVHVLQFGDSHTASDDWVNAMRTAAQSIYGNGGPGFIHPGHPYLGYRRFDASGSNSTGWKTDGNKSHQEDPNQGLAHISISTSLPNQTVRLAAVGELLGLFYMTQPGGGQIELTIDGEKTVVSTDVSATEPGPGYFSRKLVPGQHEILLRTMNFAPVRLFGWTLDNSSGVTFETLGINGEWANKILDANEGIWSAELAERAPGLVILAFGTNEANSGLWNADQYRSDLKEIIARIRRAAPAASILLVGPPDCGRTRPLAHLSEVIDIQRETAAAQNVAFWDWRLHMGGARIVSQWVIAGLGQADYVHLTGEGYRLIGNLLFKQIEKAHSENQ
jgi:lysophospholipase L1-like esterase